MTLKLRNRVFELLQQIPYKRWTPSDLAWELFRLYPVECQEKKARSKAIETDDALVSQIAREIYGSRGRWEDNYPWLQSEGENPRRLYWDGTLTAVSTGEQVSPSVAAEKVALNRILFGPPGTGKTYSTIEASLEVLDPEFLAEQRLNSSADDELHHALKARVDELDREGRIRFVTFHQSFSYEDFIEGLRAVSNDKGQIEYPVEPGVFKRLCDQARTSSANAGTSSNQRIEVLLDRDHCLGHAYFLPLRDEPSLALLASIFRQQILPLLQEYFFEDWQRIHWVLNDHNKEDGDQFVQEVKIDFLQLFGEKGPVDSFSQRWKINERAFERIHAYLAISRVAR